MKDFARGGMRTYQLMVEKAQKWNADKEIQDIVRDINVQEPTLQKLTKSYSAGNAKKLLEAPLDREELANARLPYERLDQLTMEILFGTR